MMASFSNPTAAAAAGRAAAPTSSKLYAGFQPLAYTICSGTCRAKMCFSVISSKHLQHPGQGHPAAYSVVDGRAAAAQMGHAACLSDDCRAELLAQDVWVASPASLLRGLPGGWGSTGDPANVCALLLNTCEVSGARERCRTSQLCCRLWCQRYMLTSGCTSPNNALETASSNLRGNGGAAPSPKPRAAPTSRPRCPVAVCSCFRVPCCPANERNVGLQSGSYGTSDSRCMDPRSVMYIFSICQKCGTDKGIIAVSLWRCACPMPTKAGNVRPLHTRLL